MPDKWEYPWYAAWDLAFHCVAMARIDPALREGAADPAQSRLVHASERPAAGLRMGVFRRQSAGAGLGRVPRLSDRPRAGGDRRHRLPRAHPPQAAHQLHLGGSTARIRTGATSFRAASSASTTSGHSIAPSRRRTAASSIRPTVRPGWRCMPSTFYGSRSRSRRSTRSTRTSRRSSSSTSLTIASAMAHAGEDDVALWDQADGFYYDTLRLPGGSHVPLRLRSMVGLIPIFAVEVLDEEHFREAARIYQAAALVPGEPSPRWQRWSRAGTSAAWASATSSPCCAGIA